MSLSLLYSQCITPAMAHEFGDAFTLLAEGLKKLLALESLVWAFFTAFDLGHIHCADSDPKALVCSQCYQTEALS